MSRALKPEDVFDVFQMMTEIEIQAAVSTIKVGEEKDQLMGQGYILAIERCRNVLRSILKDVQC